MCSQHQAGSPACKTGVMSEKGVPSCGIEKEFSPREFVVISNEARRIKNQAKGLQVVKECDPEKKKRENSSRQ